MILNSPLCEIQLVGYLLVGKSLTDKVQYLFLALGNHRESRFVHWSIGAGGAPDGDTTAFPAKLTVCVVGLALLL
jgi:hypothetical protein